jgi:hypothetical protein
MMVDSIQLETKSTTSISNDSITDSINSVLSQTNNEINNDCTFTNKKRNKRTVSNDNEDANLKKKRSNIEIKEISEAERLINIMMERLDNLEEENSHLSGLNNVISRELKEVKNNYIKLNANHTSLVKIVEALKKDKGKIEQDLSSLDQRVTNANNDEMTGVFNNIKHSTSKSFADLFKGNSDKSVSELMADIINTFNDYNKQKRGRENNVIIFGMNHVNKDNANTKIKYLLNKLNTNINFKNPILLVKNGTAIDSPPIKITLDNEESKYRLLKAAKQLKEINQHEHTRINISQDLNDIDRVLYKKLVQEKKVLNDQLLADCNYYYGVRGTKVVKIIK